MLYITADKILRYNTTSAISLFFRARTAICPYAKPHQWNTVMKGGADVAAPAGTGISILRYGAGTVLMTLNRKSRVLDKMDANFSTSIIKS